MYKLKIRILCHKLRYSIILQLKSFYLIFGEKQVEWMHSNIDYNEIGCVIKIGQDIIMEFLFDEGRGWVLTRDWLIDWLNEHLYFHNFSVNFERCPQCA